MARTKQVRRRATPPYPRTTMAGHGASEGRISTTGRDEGSFKCDNCGRAYDNRESLRKLVYDRHRGSRYPYSECPDRSYTRRYDPKQHRLKHHCGGSAHPSTSSQGQQANRQSTALPSSQPAIRSQVVSKIPETPRN